MEKNQPVESNDQIEKETRVVRIGSMLATLETEHKSRDEAEEVLLNLSDFTPEMIEVIYETFREKLSGDKGVVIDKPLNALTFKRETPGVNQAETEVSMSLIGQFTTL